MIKLVFFYNKKLLFPLCCLFFLFGFNKISPSLILDSKSNIYNHNLLKNHSSDFELYNINEFSNVNKTEKSFKTTKSEILPLFIDNWNFFFFLILIFFLLYILRKFEKNRQLQKFKLEKNDFMEGLFENAPFAVAVTDSYGTISTINEIFEIIFGYSKEEVIGNKLDDFIIDDESSNESQNLSKYSLEEHQKVYKVCKRKCKDGTIVDVELFTTPNFVGGKQYGYLLYYNDITKRLKTEAELVKTFTTYRAVLDTLQDAYFEANRRGLITYCNQALAKATGYENKEDLVGKHFRGFVSRKAARKFLENFKKLYETNKPIAPFDLEYVTKDGLEFSSEIVASPIFENDKVVGTRGIIRDISLRVKAETILREAKEAAEYRANELASINNVAEKISHSLDLQDILNSACFELTKIFPVRSAGISLLNKDKNSLEILAFHSLDHLEGNHQGKINNLYNNIDAVSLISIKKTVIIQADEKDLQIMPINSLSKHNGSKSFMIVPLINRGISIGIIGMPAKDPNYSFSENDIELAETISSQIAGAIENARLHAQTETALDIAEQDLEIGRQIQSGFFPTELPEIQGWDIETYFNAARQVSGDFYDIFRIEKTEYFAFVVADVCDKGVGAALFMVLLRSLIRSYTEQSIKNVDISDLLLNIGTKVNQYIVDIHGQSNMFATILFSVLDPSTNKLYFINGGHEASIMIDYKGNIKRYLEPTAPAFGFSKDLAFEVGIVDFSPGDLLVSFTDGLTDAKNAAGKFYSEGRLNKVIKKGWPSAFSIVKYLEVDVLSHIGDNPQFDDITLVAIRRIMDPEVLNHCFNYKADISNLPLFRKFAVDACRKLKVDEEKIERFKLAVDEICSNIILYGYKDIESGNIKLSIRKLNNEIIVEIEDTGHPFNPDLIETPNLSDDIDKREIGGLGLFFVNEIIDEINYQSKDGMNCFLLKIK